MTRTEPERTPVEFDKRQFVVSVALAALFLFLFSIFSDLFSVRLREISSILAAAILKAFTFPVTREGTILSLAEMRFDVVPACSGSNTLQALIAFGILWCGLHPRLGLGKRLAAMLFIVPIALTLSAADGALALLSLQWPTKLLDGGDGDRWRLVIACAVLLPPIEIAYQRVATVLARRGVEYKPASLR